MHTLHEQGIARRMHAVLQNLLSMVMHVGSAPCCPLSAK